MTVSWLGRHHTMVVLAAPSCTLNKGSSALALEPGAVQPCVALSAVVRKGKFVVKRESLCKTSAIFPPQGSDKVTGRHSTAYHVSDQFCVGSIARSSTGLVGKGHMGKGCLFWLKKADFGIFPKGVSKGVFGAFCRRVVPLCVGVVLRRRCYPGQSVEGLGRFVVLVVLLGGWRILE